MMSDTGLSEEDVLALSFMHIETEPLGFDEDETIYDDFGEPLTEAEQAQLDREREELERAFGAGVRAAEVDA